MVLQRQGLLSTSLVALVLVAGRVLFDALNALCWTRWEGTAASWWTEAKEELGEKGQKPPRLRPGAPGA